MSIESLLNYLFLDIHYELTNDLQRILDEDLVLLKEQIESINLEQLYHELKKTCECIEKTQLRHKVLSLPFFTETNLHFGRKNFRFILCFFFKFFFEDTEVVRPLADSTIRLLKTYEIRILSTQVDRLLEEVKDKRVFHIKFCFSVLF